MKKIILLLAMFLVYVGVSAQQNPAFNSVRLNTLKAISDSLISLQGSLVPAYDSAFNLGNDTLRWNRIYADTIDANTILGQVYEQDAVIFSDGAGALSSDSNLINVIGGNLNVGDYAAGTGVNFTWIGFGSIGVNSIQSQGVGEIDMVDSVDFNRNAIFSGNARVLGITRLSETPLALRTDSFLCKDGTTDQVTTRPFEQWVYLPVDSGGANIDDVTFDTASYLRIGNSVTMYGVVTIDPTTTATPTFFSVSLPIFPITWNINRAGGTFQSYSVNEGGGIIMSGPTTVIFQFLPTATGANVFSYSFTYRLD